MRNWGPEWLFGKVLNIIMCQILLRYNWTKIQEERLLEADFKISYSDMVAEFGANGHTVQSWKPPQVSSKLGCWGAILDDMGNATS